ncbi:beta-ketoacyl-ACP synthase 3 [Saccharopolyspora rosea]|uniref:Beta-ketoacyl-ACP synthase 3 n=1 Tax=Saccharopolyspora rosea TaxID=524884 RepID=A0ABW3FZ41_9PSEU|nr:beta-ketoacyl-ACP synthase 3 [Saccharopolyspora rosea]
MARIPGARIAALGHHLPDAVLTSEDVGRRVGVAPEWIIARTGIRRRHRAAADETVADMATAAARHALRRLPTAPPLDAVIVATSTAESPMPAVAARVGARLGLDEPVAFDVNAACAGFCTALAVADGLVRAGASAGALVIGADRPTAWLDWADRDTAVLFGDGAGAAVVLPHTERAIGPVLWGSLGERADAVGIDPDTRTLHQQGRAVYRWATGLGPIARRTCERGGLPPEKLAAFVPHQANLRIITALARSLDLDAEAVATDVVDTGNTIAATVPIALSRLVERGGAGPGDTVLLFGFGAGLSYAGQLVTL